MFSVRVESEKKTQKTETTLGISNRGKLILGIGYIGNGRAEKPNRKE